jgi:hypothetical protein
MMEEEFEQGFADAVNGEPEVQTEEPVAEEPIAEEPIAEESEEPIAEEPVAEEPVEYENVQARVVEVEYQADSDSGRVSALSRKLYETRQGMPTPLAEGSPEPTFDKWNTLKEEYPDIAGGTAEKLGELEARVERMVEDRLAPIREMEEQRYIDSQVAQVKGAYPDWQDTVHSDDFSGWLGKQPLKVQDLKGSMESEDYIYLLKCYNADKSEQVEEIRSSRASTLKSNVAVPKRGPSRPPGPPDDFESAFAYYAQKD